MPYGTSNMATGGRTPLISDDIRDLDRIIFSKPLLAVRLGVELQEFVARDGKLRSNTGVLESYTD